MLCSTCLTAVHQWIAVMPLPRGVLQPADWTMSKWTYLWHHNSTAVYSITCTLVINKDLHTVLSLLYFHDSWWNTKTPSDFRWYGLKLKIAYKYRGKLTRMQWEEKAVEPQWKERVYCWTSINKMICCEWVDIEEHDRRWNLFYTGVQIRMSSCLLSCILQRRRNTKGEQVYTRTDSLWMASVSFFIFPRCFVTTWKELTR